MKEEIRAPLGLWSADGALDIYVTVREIADREDYLVTIDRAPISPRHRKATMFRREDLRSQLAESDGFVLEETEQGFQVRRLKGTPATRVARQVGSMLFQLLFPESSAAYDLLGRCCELARDRDTRLRVLLELPENLTGIPWETLKSPPSGAYSQLLLKSKFLVVRFHGHLELLARESDGENIVLLVMANPIDTVRSGLSESFTTEQRELADWFRERKYQVEVIDGKNTRGQLETMVKEISTRRLRSCGFHFIGHGDVDLEGGYLVGTGKNRKADKIYWDDLSKILESLTFDWAFLNACETARSPVGSQLASVATSFSVLGEVPMVLAYLRPVDTREAEKISKDLYSRVLIENNPIDQVVQDIQRNLEDHNPGGLVLLGRPPRPDGCSEVRQKGGAQASMRESAEPTLPEMIKVAEGKLRRGLAEQQIRAIIGRFEQRQFAAFDEDELFSLLGRERNEILLVPGFEIARTPITRRQFRAFLLATGHQPSRSGLANEQWMMDAEQLLELPMTHVSYRDALAFCEWTGCRLPTGDEWKRAFRSGSRRLYPWGNAFDPTLCHCAEGNRGASPLPVGRFPTGKSGSGCLDLVGNVWEWTSDFRSQGQRQILGGSFKVRCEIFGLPLGIRWALEEERHADLGFRVARGLNAETPRESSE